MIACVQIGNTIVQGDLVRRGPIATVSVFGKLFTGRLIRSERR